MNLNQLKYFATVAQINNLSKSAEILGVNQPALSKSINKLEEELGIELFDRKGKKITLNPQGERFLQCVNDIYDDLEYAKSDINKILGSENLHIRIGAAGCSGEIIQCAAEFRKINPECNFSFDFDIESQEDLDIKNYDILIYPDEMKYKKFGGYEITTEKYVLVADKNHPLTEYSILSARFLENQDIVFLRTDGHPEYASHICKALDVKFRSVSYTNTRLSQIQMVEEGLGIAIVPESVSGYFPSEKLKLIPFINKNFTRKMMLGFRREKYLSPKALQFREELIRHYGLIIKE